MAKNMSARHVDDELEYVHPSCMWGFLHAFDYHHWHFNIKRMLLQKINPGKRIKDKLSNRSSKAKELVHDQRELQKLLNQEEKHFSSVRESGVNHKRSLKARIKSFIAEDTSTEGNSKQPSSSISSQSRLRRTYSIHHLEPPDHGVGEICTDWEHPILFFPSDKEHGARKLQSPPKKKVKDKQVHNGKKSKEISNMDASKDKEHGNGLEVFKVRKDLFLEIVQDKDGSLRKFSHTLPGSNAKARLTKSGSFPAADFLKKRSLEPVTLKQKQSEIWSVPKGEKLPTVTMMPNVDKFKNSKHIRSKSLPLEYSSKGSKLGQALNFIIENTSDSDKVNKEVLKPLKESKQSDHFEVREGRNQANTSGLSVLSEVSNGVDAENYFSSHETKEHSFSKQSHKSSSLNESMDKYNWLFENNFGKDTNLHASRSLKLRSAYDIGSDGNASTFFRRIRSLSSADIYSSHHNGAHDDANLEGWQITTVEENSSSEQDSYLDELRPIVFSPTTEVNEPPGNIEESVHQNEFPDKDGHVNQMDKFAESGENIAVRMEGLEDTDHGLTVGKSTLYVEQESNHFTVALSELSQSRDTPAFETSFEEVPRSLDYQASEGCDQFDEKESSSNSKKSFDMETSPLLSSTPNPDHMKDAELVGSYNEFDADLDYVKDILETSGFAKDASNMTWHSSNQPLDPLVFDEIEAYWHKECSAEDYCSCDHHQLLFDLVNEKLLKIYQRSFTYYPRALTSSCYIRQFPEGERIVDEICTSVGALMRLKTQQKQSLECLVALDVGKDDGWMNLQLESECAGLELEDMIFDELIEELLCF